MFDLRGKEFPSDADTLRQELGEAVRRRVEVPEGRQTIMLEAPNWPEGQRLAVDLSGGRLVLPADPGELREHARKELKPPTIVSERRPGPLFHEFEVLGDPVNVGAMECRLSLVGRDVRFDFGRDADGTVVMAPAAGQGKLAASVPKDQLLDFIRRQAIDSAAEKGLQMEQVDLSLASPSDRSIEISGTMAGRKNLGLVSPRLAITFAARIEVDDELVGHLTQLDLSGKGMVLDALLALLRPKVAQIKAKPIPIRQLLGNFVPVALELRDAAIKVDEEIRLSATFGSTAGQAGRHE
jgi:hypothetical protein